MTNTLAYFVAALFVLLVIFLIAAAVEKVLLWLFPQRWPHVAENREDWQEYQYDPNDADGLVKRPGWYRPRRDGSTF